MGRYNSLDKLVFAEMTFHHTTFSWRHFREKHSLGLLNLGQIGAIVNDNIYKLTMIFLFIDVFGADKASLLTSQVGAVFVAPFLLFSSAAGVLADRFSKQRVLGILKLAELGIFLAALFAFSSESLWACFALLFLLGAHSAVFGPSKYGIIPELVHGSDIPKANGIITSCTYLAIILGTFLGSFLSHITSCQYLIVIGISCIIALLGLLPTLVIKATPPQATTTRMSCLFLREIYQTMKFCQRYPHLQLSMWGSAYFLFIGAFTQLNIIPFIIEALHRTPIEGGYLFLCTALGIALGSIIAGQILQRGVDLSMPCVAAFFLATFLWLLYLVSQSFVGVVLVLFFLGIAGGLFIVPFDTFNQTTSPDTRRGQVIGVANFLGFCGVLCASLLLYFMSQIWRISAAKGFAVVGTMTFIACLVFTLRLADYGIRLCAKVCCPHSVSLPATRCALLLRNPTLRKILALYFSASAIHVVFLYRQKKWYHYLVRCVYSFQALPMVAGWQKMLSSLPAHGSFALVIPPPGEALPLLAPISHTPEKNWHPSPSHNSPFLSPSIQSDLTSYSALAPACEKCALESVQFLYADIVIPTEKGQAATIVLSEEV